MIGIVAVAHIEPGDIHTGLHQLDRRSGAEEAGPSVQTILALRTD